MEIISSKPSISTAQAEMDHAEVHYFNRCAQFFSRSEEFDIDF